MTRQAIIVAGPTASGKSALAIALAKEFGGVVVNADSMQVYSVLRLLTARPSMADEAQAPHRLYGVLPPSQACSAMAWVELARPVLDDIWNGGRIPIITGGTGLYLRALTEGFSPMPEIPAAFRAEAHAVLDEIGNHQFHARLAQRDPEIAARLHPGNTQRLIRAWEVVAATGRKLSDWQKEPPQGGIASDYLTLVMNPPRPVLYENCEGRFLSMIEHGALAEVQAMLDLNLDPALPAMKALGLPELAAVLRQEIELSQAIAAAQQATRNYAKRQQTWFRHQMPQAKILTEKLSESMKAEIFSIIRLFLLTHPR